MGWISIQVTSKGQVHPGITKPGNVPRDRRLSRFKPISTISVDPILVSPSWRPKPSDQSRSFIFCHGSLCSANYFYFGVEGRPDYFKPSERGLSWAEGEKKKKDNGPCQLSATRFAKFILRYSGKTLFSQQSFPPKELASVSSRSNPIESGFSGVFSRSRCRHNCTTRRETKQAGWGANEIAIKRELAFSVFFFFFPFFYAQCGN